MTIAELFQSLSYGELSNLALSLEGSGEIRIKDQPRIIQAADEALLHLHSKFILSTKNIWIETLKHITYYHFDKRFAESSFGNTNQEYLYIKDLLGDPFEGDVLKVLSVFDDQEVQLPLNDVEHPMSVFTPQPRMLQVPDPVDGALLDVVYQAKHVPLKLDDLDQEIDLPFVLVPALNAYISYRIYSAMNTQEATVKAAEHLGNYEAICQNATDHDLVNTSSSTTNIRFQRNGWV
jgi:hypothetical protein